MKSQGTNKEGNIEGGGFKFTFLISKFHIEVNFDDSFVVFVRYQLFYVALN